MVNFIPITKNPQMVYVFLDSAIFMAAINLANITVDVITTSSSDNRGITGIISIKLYLVVRYILGSGWMALTCNTKV